MTFIHELADWPDFTWDAQVLVDLLAAVRHEQGRHLGAMEGLGFPLQQEAGVEALVSEVVGSSAIEGEGVPSSEVRSSIARRLGLDAGGLPPPSRPVDGFVELMLDATQRYQEPLTAERLFGWHAALFPTARSGMHRITVGAWRKDEDGPMRVISGAVGRERVHFEAPAAERLPGEMDRFLDWFETPSSVDPVLRAGIAHLWFVTIHPFDDGNGRIARAITDMALARADRTAQRFYSMSSTIEAQRRTYYGRLESAQQGSLDITAWLVWFLACLQQALGDARTLLARVLRKARFTDRARSHGVNQRQETILMRMLEPTWEGNMTTSKYARLTKCHQDSALRDIRQLVSWGLLVRNPGGGRSTSYRLADAP